MKNRHLLAHLLLAAVLSFGISLAAWRFLDVFELTPFILVSTSATILGALAGWASGKYLITTFAATVLLRSAVLYFAIGS